MCISETSKPQTDLRCTPYTFHRCVWLLQILCMKLSKLSLSLASLWWQGNIKCWLPGEALLRVLWDLDDCQVVPKPGEKNNQQLGNRPPAATDVFVVSNKKELQLFGRWVRWEPHDFPMPTCVCASMPQSMPVWIHGFLMWRWQKMRQCDLSTAFAQWLAIKSNSSLEMTAGSCLAK